MRDAFVNTSPLDDVVVPFISMVSGKKVDERLQRHFGDVMIEDMPLPYFCLSSNLTSGALKVHKTGLLRTALRASISLPGVLPPVIEDGQVLVDGAVMRSFPATMMRNTHLGTVIASMSRGARPRSEDADPAEKPGQLVRARRMAARSAHRFGDDALGDDHHDQRPGA